jgi:Na+/H+-translocating membrane pyrophosphatase
MYAQNADIQNINNQLQDVLNAKEALEKLKNTKNDFVVGDTVGDPLKDTAGPTATVLPLLSIAILIVDLI